MRVVDASKELIKFLDRLYLSRYRSNPSFSRRAFAKTLAISPSYLSEITSGKKSLTPKKALEIAATLGLSIKESRHFEILARLTRRSLETRERNFLLKELEEAQILPDLSMVSPRGNESFLDWRVKAFMSLLEIHREYCSNRFSQELEISPGECDRTLHLLLRRGLVERSSPENEIPCYIPKNNPVIWSKIQDPDLQRYNQSILDLAKRAIRDQDQFQRIAVNATLAFSAREMEEAWRLINECAQKLIRLSEAIQEKDVVYQASLHFFQLTNPPGGGKSLRKGRKAH